MKQLFFILSTLLVYTISSKAQKSCFSGNDLVNRFKYDGHSSQHHFSESFVLKDSLFAIAAFENITPKDKSIIIYFHGNGESLWSKGLQSKLRMLDKHHGLLAIDYPGYGKSTGPNSIHDLIYAGEQAFNYVTQKYPGKKIIIWGHSLGSILAIELTKNKQIEKLICEGTISNLNLMQSNLEKYYTKKSGHHISLQLCREPVFDNLKSIEENKNKTLFIHAENDDFTSVETVRKMMSKIKNQETQLFIVPNRGHNYSHKVLKKALLLI